MIICAPDIGGIAASLYAKISRARLCIWSEATPMTERKISYLKSKLRETLYRNALNFLVPGSLAESYLRQYRPEANIYWAPNAIDEERFCINRDELSQKFRAERLVITFSGSLVERKGIRLLLEVFRQLQKETPGLRDRCREELWEQVLLILVIIRTVMWSSPDSARVRFISTISRRAIFSSCHHSMTIIR